VACFWITGALGEKEEVGEWVGAGAGGAGGDEDCLDGRVTGEVIVDKVEGEERMEGLVKDH